MVPVDCPLWLDLPTHWLTDLAGWLVWLFGHNISYIIHLTNIYPSPLVYPPVEIPRLLCLPIASLLERMCMKYFTATTVIHSVWNISQSSSLYSMSSFTKFSRYTSYSLHTTTTALGSQYIWGNCWWGNQDTTDKTIQAKKSSLGGYNCSCLPFRIIIIISWVQLLTWLIHPWDPDRPSVLIETLRTESRRRQVSTARLDRSCLLPFTKLNLCS